VVLLLGHGLCSTVLLVQLLLLLLLLFKQL
jgi:hypothetical protein